MQAQKNDQVLNFALVKLHILHYGIIILFLQLTFG